jgi:hypothetical protein
VRYPFDAQKPQFHKPIRCWKPVKVVGDSPGMNLIPKMVMLTTKT